MKNDQRKEVVKELISLIEKGNAHVGFDDAIAGLPAELRGVTPQNLPYSIWQLVEHIRIAQKDIVDFSVSENFESLNWPADYWTAPKEQVSDEEWEQSLAEIKADRARFFDLLNDENNELMQPFPWGEGQSLFREAALIADHNAYHTAEIVVIRRLLNAWD